MGIAGHVEETWKHVITKERVKRTFRGAATIL
jgi:hypothetical protein